jgi:hypothetical protein
MACYEFIYSVNAVTAVLGVISGDRCHALHSVTCPLCYAGGMGTLKYICSTGSVIQSEL